MSKRAPYPKEFRERIIELARAGRSFISLQKEFGCHATTIGEWLRQADLDSGKRADGLTSDEKSELSRLRRENARLKEEREILSKAAAWFAQERVGTPKKRFDS